MYKILLVDDQEIKRNDLVKVINSSVAQLDWLEFPNRIKSVLNNDYDIILLDMTFPGEDFGGMGVLNRLMFHHYRCPVIIISQYDNFVDLKSEGRDVCFKNDNYGKESNSYMGAPKIDTLKAIHDYLSQVCIDYYGCVLYSAFNSAWIRNIKTFFKEILQNEDVIIG